MSPGRGRATHHDDHRGPVDPNAAGLFEAIYDELRELAQRSLRRERPDHTLQPTALVHEVYLKLAASKGIPETGRTHFLGIAARAMRQVLIDHARGVRAAKRGRGGVKVDLEDALGRPDGPPVDFSHITEALAGLAALDERAARVGELRLFGGLTNAETAQSIGVSVPTVERDWRVARAWLRREIDESDRP